jgi:hypothetical protein
VVNNAVSPPPPAAPVAERPMVQRAESGEKHRMIFAYALNPDCSSMGYPVIKMVKQPEHGTIAIEHGEEYPVFPKESALAVCNSAKVPVTYLFYTSEPNFKGLETLSYDAIRANGAFVHREFEINVH